MENGRGQTSDNANGAQPWADIPRTLLLLLSLVQRVRDTGSLGDGQSKEGALEGL